MAAGTLGFVIVRHVNSFETNLYWQEAYRSIRNYYPNPILIVDDGSHPEHLRSDLVLINTIIIRSPYRGRAELLGYYYYYQTRFVERAVILHDSVFLERWIDWDAAGSFRTLWSFNHQFDDDALTVPLLAGLTHLEEVLAVYPRKETWRGCFGVMSVISWALLNQIQTRYNFFGAMLTVMTTRARRSMLERIWPCLVELVAPGSGNLPPLISDIFEQGWGLTYAQYKWLQRRNAVLWPLVKVWTGR